MKKLGTLLGVLILVATALVANSGSVLAFPDGVWVSGVTVANLSSDTATVMIDFYDQNGDLELHFNGGTIAGNGAKTWYLPDVWNSGTSFIGSAVVSADRAIAAIVNTQLPSGSNPTRVGTSTGVGSPSQTVYATQLMKGYHGWNSYCAVQNTGSSAANVTATFYNANGSQAASYQQNIPAYASYLFDQSADSRLPAGFNGSAKFVSPSASHPLAVVCNFYNTGANAGSSQFHSYNGMGQGGSTLYVPRIVKDYYNYQSGLKVQNIGSEALNVNVSYIIKGKVHTQTSPSIGPGQAWGPYMGDESQLPASLAGVSGSGSAVITINNQNANKLIVATVNEDNRTSPAGRGVTYEAALAAEAAASLVFPQVTAEYYGYSSGIQVMKVGTGTASCEACYSASGNVSAFCDAFTLTDASPSWDQFAPNASGMNPGGYDNYNSSVTINCTGGDAIGIANLSFRQDVDPRYGNLKGDSFTTARGIAK